MVAGRRSSRLRRWHLTGMVLVVLFAGGGPAGTMVGVDGSADRVRVMLCPVGLRVLPGLRAGTAKAHVTAARRRAAL